MATKTEYGSFVITPPRNGSDELAFDPIDKEGVLSIGVDIDALTYTTRFYLDVPEVRALITYLEAQLDSIS